MMSKNKNRILLGVAIASAWMADRYPQYISLCAIVGLIASGWLIKEYFCNGQEK